MGWTTDRKRKSTENSCLMINDHYCALVPSLETGTSLPLDSKGAQQSAGAALTTLQRATAQLDSRLR
jgi:hypothetical protein